jgi:type IX secretion system PorP/SprF family membrane protein
MGMRRVVIILMILLSRAVIAQDIHFSQIARTPLMFNPAHTGATNADFRVSTHYRSQWASISNPYVTYALNLDGKLKKKRWRNKHFGIGLVLLNDKAGDLDFKRFKGNLLVGYHQQLDRRNYLSGGLNIGFVQHSIDMTNAQWDNQYDGTGFNPLMPSGEPGILPAFTSVDASAGILWTYVTSETTISSDNANLIQLGGSVSHLSKPKLSFFNMPEEDYYFRYLFHGISSFGINNTSNALRPSFMYQRKGKEQELVLGLMIRQRLKEKSHFTGFIEQFDFSYGLYYRVMNDAIIPSLYLNYANWGFGVSYDVNLSKLTVASSYRGGIEFSLKFVTPNPYHVTRTSYPSM